MNTIIQRYVLFIFFVSVTVLLFSTCELPLHGKMPPPTVLSTEESEFIPQGYSLFWNDEFDYNGSPSSENWKCETGGWGWGNNELQNYTSHVDNARVQNGVLSITAKLEDTIVDGEITNNYTSARLNKLNSDKFGYIEVRAKTPNGSGTWPAIWLCGKNWPSQGEIDILEQFAGTNYASANVHWGIWPNHQETGPQSGLFDGISGVYHLYWLLWEPGSIKIGVDSNILLTHDKNPSDTIEAWPFDTYEESLILNLAITESGGPIENSSFPHTLEIDYVRIYKK